MQNIMISVVISAYNEERHIKECIESAMGLADEIIVVDNSSTDKTAVIAKKAGAVVFHQENNPLKIDLQKNFGFNKASNEWIVSLDADERLTPKSIDEINKAIKGADRVMGFWIPRKNIIFKKWIKHSIWWPDYQLRIFRKGKGKFLTASVHKKIDIKGETRHLSEPLIHYNYESISQFVTRMNNIYTEIEADSIVSNGERIHWTSAVKLPLSDFLKTYFLLQGYKDGLHGLVLSILQSFYMFLVFAKVWERQGFYEKDQKEVVRGLERELVDISYQAKYWLYKTYAKETKNPFKKMLYYLSRKTLKI